jgi:serine-type D-Ala-D-Ala carboxypeptidase (penicillin-binding protein 5/6)
VCSLAVLLPTLVSFASTVRNDHLNASAAGPPALQHQLRSNAAAAKTAGGAYYRTDFLAAHPSPDLGLHAQAAVLVDLDRRQVLWEHDSRSPRAPASLTKMMTAIVALDHASLDREVTVPAEATGVEPDIMGLTAGEVVTVRDLLYGLFLDSGNDAAETLAQTLLPRARFIAEMNAKARAWGLQQTQFSNPSGLDAAGLASSPYDLAVIAGHLAVDHPELMEIAGTKEMPIAATDKHKAFDPYSLNKLLWIYPGATGLKTGFTDDAGGCVVGTATRDGRHLVAVVMNSDIFFTDAGKLLDYGFATPKT